MAEITRIIIDTTLGKTVTLKPNDLSNPLRKKLRKEIEKFLIAKQVITEPKLNEGAVNER